MHDSRIYNRKGMVVVYTIILVNIGLIIVGMVASNTLLLRSNYDFYQTQQRLFSGAFKKFNFALKHTIHLNSNGGGVVDDIGCPDSITLSGNTMISTISSSLSYSEIGGIGCSSSYNSENVVLYYNNAFNDFEKAKYGSYEIPLNGKQGIFSDPDNTYIDFSSYIHTGDNQDDNFNSDNYKVNSTDGYNYPDNYADDDVIARKTLHGYILPDTGYQNIFWSNTQIQEYISQNINNSDSINSKLGTTPGNIFLNIDGNYHLKIVKFDKNTYNSTSELIVLDEVEAINQASFSGYIQENGTLSGNITGSEYNFDVVNNDYALFVKNTGTQVLSYNLLAQEGNGKNIYINPIDDSPQDIIKVLGYHILGTGGEYIGKTFEMIGKKE